MSRDDDLFTVIACTAIATFCGCFFIGVLILKSDRKSFQHEAIKRNYATWTNDGEGNPVFTWKEPAQ